MIFFKIRDGFSALLQQRPHLEFGRVSALHLGVLFEVDDALLFLRDVVAALGEGGRLLSDLAVQVFDGGRHGGLFGRQLGEEGAPLFGRFGLFRGLDSIVFVLRCQLFLFAGQLLDGLLQCRFLGDELFRSYFFLRKRKQ